MSEIIIDGKDCTTCEHSYIKDFAYLICDINGLLDLKDVEKSKECKFYREVKNV